MDTLIEYIKDLDQRVVVVAASVLCLWIFVKAFRSLIKFAFVITLLFVVVWKVPAVHEVLLAFIK